MITLPTLNPQNREQIIARVAAFDPDLNRVQRGAASIEASKYITADDEVKAMLKTAEILAFKDSNVLILGETGTGKELVARILHGPRSTKAPHGFVPVNCSGIVDTLFESILFGHVRGSFTGALTTEIGLLRAAQDGTAFLDEVGDLPLSQQAKLLRVLQDKKVRPVGDTNQYSINCRFVFATNKDLRKMVSTGAFREDLYFRISTHVLRTKPLRDRPDDARLIASSFCTQNKFEPPPSPIPTAVTTNTGNIRALQNWLIRINELTLEPDEALIDL